MSDLLYRASVLILVCIGAANSLTPVTGVEKGIVGIVVIIATSVGVGSLCYRFMGAETK